MSNSDDRFAVTTHDSFFRTFAPPCNIVDLCCAVITKKEPGKDNGLAFNEVFNLAH